MTCPSEDTLLRATLGDLSVNELNALQHHQLGCARCRDVQTSLEQLTMDLRAPAALVEGNEERFIASVLEACRAQPRRSARAQPSALSRLMVAAFAAVAVFGLALPAGRPGTRGGTWTARGSSPDVHASAFADLYYLRNGVMLPLAGATLTDGDAFVVRCTNRGVASSYLAVFALDASGDAHWIYPAYLDPDSNPQSIPIAAQTLDLMLDEVVEPEAPAVGPLRVIALSSDTPLRVHEIERQLDAFTSDQPRLPFANVQVQQWRARWDRH
jgi:hypothetical protein